MKNITVEESNVIIRRTAAAISQLQAGEDAIGVLSRIYCQNLPDKSPRQGQLMAKEVLSWIAKFQDGMDEALEAPDNYVQRQLKNALEGLPLEQQCALLRQQLEEFERLNSLESFQETELAKVHRAAREALPASEQIRDTLLTEVSRTLIGEKLSIEPFFAEGGSVSRNRKAAKACIGENLLLAMTAMVIYTMAKNGELSGLPKEVSLSQVVIGVCAEDQAQQIQLQEKLGYLSEKEAQKSHSALRAVAFTLLITSAVGLAGGTLFLLARFFDTVAVAALGAYMMVWLGAVLGIYYSAADEMVIEEADRIPMIPVEVLHEDGQKATQPRKLPGQKHADWPDKADLRQGQNRKFTGRSVSETRTKSAPESFYFKIARDNKCQR